MKTRQDATRRCISSRTTTPLPAKGENRATVKRRIKTDTTIERLFAPQQHLVLTAIIAYSLLFGLGACGGGGGGSSNMPTAAPAPESRVTITNDNALKVATEVYSTILTTIKTGENNGLLARSTPLPAHIELKTARASQSQTTDCEKAGTLTLTVDDVDNNVIASPGDKLGFLFKDCTDNDGNVVNGKIDAVIVFYSSETNFTFDYFYNLYANDAQGRTERFEGPMRIRSDSTGTIKKVTMTSDSISREINQVESELIGLQFYIESSATHRLADYAVELSSKDLKGKVQITTDPNLEFTTQSENPETGVLQIAGANGTSAQVNADTGNIATAFLIINNGTSVSSEEIFWSHLKQETQ